MEGHERGILNPGAMAMGAIVKHGMDTLKLYTVDEETGEKKYWIDNDSPPKVLPNGNLQVTLSLPPMDGALWWEANAFKALSCMYSPHQYKNVRKMSIDELPPDDSE